MQELFQIQQDTIRELKNLVENLKSGKDPKELLHQIEELEKELKRVKKSKRYGLIFEEKTEEFDEKSKNALPLLKEIKELYINTKQDNSPTNVIIEGDNYHSLSCLQYTHQNKIDVIYIDPPYNTGNKDFIYNDNYIDKEDSFRHSKWLSFMKKRLELAKNLLSEKGVIFISIDDNEFAQLKLLCDEVFGENNLIETFIWEKTQHFGRQKINSYSNGEYILCYGKEIYNNGLKELLVEKINENLEDAPLYNASNPSRKLIFPAESVIFNIPDGIYDNSEDSKYNICSPLIVKNSKNQNDLILEFHSRWSQNKINEEIVNGAKYWVKSKNFSIRVIYGDGKVAKNSPKKLIFTNQNNSLCSYNRFGNKVGVNEEASKEIELILDNKNFSYPKPKSLIKYLLSLYFDYQNDNFHKSSIILDFFAGSGTTGHAVLELNKEDGGSRQFILCSNAENTKENPEKNICKNITYERNKRIIQGYTNSKGEKIDGLGGKLKYYQTDFIKIEKSRENLKTKFKNNCNDLLCIKENTFENITLKQQIPGVFLYKNANKYTIIAYEHIFLDNIKNLCKILPGKIHIYIFSLSSHFEEDFEDIKDKVELGNIPENILEVYKKIFNF